MSTTETETRLLLHPDGHLFTDGKLNQVEHFLYWHMQQPLNMRDSDKIQ